MVSRQHRAGLAAVAFAVMFSADVQAQTLYKLVDKQGKVTYVEKPPRDFDGQVIRLDIDPKANTATLPKAAAPSTERVESQKAGEERLAAARQRLDAARKALAEARANPSEDDVTRVGKKGGGTRPVASEDYERRLQKLERDVKDAEEGLEKARRAR